MPKTFGVKGSNSFNALQRLRLLLKATVNRSTERARISIQTKQFFSYDYFNVV